MGLPRQGVKLLLSLLLASFYICNIYASNRRSKALSRALRTRPAEVRTLLAKEPSKDLHVSLRNFVPTGQCLFAWVSLHFAFLLSSLVASFIWLWLLLASARWS